MNERNDINSWISVSVPQVCRAAKWVAANKFEAGAIEDIVAGALAKAVESVKKLSIEDFPSQNQFTVYMMEAARTYVITQSRNAVKRRNKLARVPLHVSCLAQDDPIIDKLANAELISHLQSISDRLKDKDKRLLQKRFFDGMTVRELADAESTSQGAIRGRLFRLLRKLRSQLEQYDESA